MAFETRILDKRLLEQPLVPSTAGSAGLDLRNCSGRDVEIRPGELAMIGTGLAVFLDSPFFAGLVMVRSSLGANGIVLANGVGLIDADYQGEVKVVLRNQSHQLVMIPDFDRVAQLVIVDVTQFVPNIVDEFSRETGRGAGGFGSTGTGSLSVVK